ncbi:hypothetical protein EDB85DRAFT_1895774 [Lactarius pseudohatsudake]|nr:hypothetical protein EDB85DRAFT_1895774 [Lactarius pseudohatsudake]
METLHRHDAALGPVLAYGAERGTQKRSPPAGSAGSTAATTLTPTPRARIRWKQRRTKCEPTDTPPVPARGTDRDAEGHEDVPLIQGSRNSDAGPERKQTELLFWLEKRLHWQHRAWAWVPHLCARYPNLLIPTVGARRAVRLPGKGRVGLMAWRNRQPRFATFAETLVVHGKKP